MNPRRPSPTPADPTSEGSHKGQVAAPSQFAAQAGYGVGGVLDALTGAVEPELPAWGGTDDAYWMRLALRSAMAAKGRASPNPTVGAVIVKDGALLATGATEPYGQRHAERCAIDAVADRSMLRGATIYTTLEPCAHWGKQPPCADLVASCGFARCVAGIRDPNPSVAGTGLARIRAAGTDIRSGVLRNELLAWHLPYLFPQLAARPLISALALDVSDDHGPHLLLGRHAGWDERDVSRRYRGWLKQRCDLVISEPSLASIAPAALAHEPWRGLLWWDSDARLARMSVAQARDLALRAKDLGIPVGLVCSPHRANAAQLDALLDAGIGHVAPPAGEDAARWLAAWLRDGKLAEFTGGSPRWVLVDDHPRLAAALAAGHALDAVHALHTGAKRSVNHEARASNGDAPGDQTAGKRDAPGDQTAGDRTAGRRDGVAAAMSRIAHHAADGTLISEYYAEHLCAALDATAW